MNFYIYFNNIFQKHFNNAWGKIIKNGSILYALKCKQLQNSDLKKIGFIFLSSNADPGQMTVDQAVFKDKEG